jgi:hypothetical protein
MTPREKIIETSLHWQRHVLNETKDQRQAERVRRSIERLTTELQLIRGNDELKRN